MLRQHVKATLISWEIRQLQLSPYCEHLRNTKSRCTSEGKWPSLDSINGKRWTGDKNKVDMLQLWPGWHPTTKKDTTHKVPFKQNPKANKPPPPKGLSERFSRELALTHVPEVSLSGKQTCSTHFTSNYHQSLSLYDIISVQFSRSVVSDSLRPHRLQHTRLPCPSTPRACPNAQVHWLGDATIYQLIKI